jgi:CRISPR/Cas system-associated exonuclease Cas4 (RecB family)
MRTIRASEIGTYLYCRRAWWYRKQGVESANQSELAAGTALHRQHGRTVLAAGLTRTVGLLLILLALIVLTVYFVNALIK